MANILTPAKGKNDPGFPHFLIPWPLGSIANGEVQVFTVTWLWPKDERRVATQFDKQTTNNKNYFNFKFLETGFFSIKPMSAIDDVTTKV